MPITKKNFEHVLSNKSFMLTVYRSLIKQEVDNYNYCDQTFV